MNEHLIGGRWTRLMICLGLCTIASCSPAGSQTNASGGVRTFSKSYGGPADEFASDAIQTSDGGYLMTGLHGGTTTIPGTGRFDQLKSNRGDLWVQKLDPQGDVTWSRVFGSQVPLNQQDLLFLESRQGPDGSIWVAYQDRKNYPITGDALADGENVVISRYDAGGSLLWTRTFDPGQIPGHPFSSPTQTAQERVVDIWPMEDGDLRVAAIVTAKVIEGQQVRDLEALWLLEVSASGNLVWDTLRLDPGGSLRYLGDDSKIRYVQMREMANDQMLVVSSGLEKPEGFPFEKDPRAEILSIGVGGIVAKRNMRAMLVLDVAAWSLQLPVPTMGGVLVGEANASTSSQGVVLRVDSLGDEVLEWSTPANSIRRVAARPLNGAGGQDVEYWLSQGERLERWTKDGLPVGFTVAAHEILGLEYESTSDRMWLMSRGAVELVNPSLVSEVSVSYPDTQAAWAGPGAPIISHSGLLTVLDANGAGLTSLADGGGASTMEAGLSCAQLSDGDFVIGGVMAYDPESPNEETIHAWNIRLDPSGNVIWQRSFPWESSASEPTLLGAVPMVESPSGVLVGLGGPRAVALDSLGNPAQATNELGEVLRCLITRTGGGYAAVGAGQAPGDPLGMAVFDANFALTSYQETSLGSDASYWTPKTLVEVPGGFAATYGRFGWANVIRFDGNGAFVEAFSYQLGPWVVKGRCHLAAATDGSYLLGVTAGNGDDFIGDGRNNSVIIKLDSAFQPVWYQVYGGLQDEYLESVKALGSGYLVAGSSHSLGQGSEAWLLRTDPMGIIAPGCNARIEGGAWPSTWSVAPVTVNPASSATAAPSPLPMDAVVVHAPTQVPALDVARQCFGSTLGEIPNSGAQSYTLTIQHMGGGEGHVLSSPGGINCGSTCEALLPAGTTVLLTPVVHQGFFFSHWANVDQDLGIEGASVLMNSNRTVQVWFE